MELDRIEADPNQPRKHFDQGEIKRLSDNIKQYGVLQPIRVRWSDTLAKWIVISGERRYRAAKLAKLTSIPCVFVENEMEESTLRTEQIIENLQREDLNPIEQAKAFKHLQDLTGWSTQRIATELNVSKSTVVRSLVLLKLPEDIQGQVDDGDISPSAAYAISKVKGETEQRKMAKKVVEQELTRDATEELRATPAPKAPRATGKVQTFTTKHARIIIEHENPKAKAADLQSELLAAVKQLGKIEDPGGVQQVTPRGRNPRKAG
ncbi:MAG: ParB/RepB/Spo0J family partition protein [Planctomycetota bacterium]